VNALSAPSATAAPASVPASRSLSASTPLPVSSALPASTALPLSTVEDIERSAKRYDDELVALRRDLHAHPELGGSEVRTTALLLERLTKAGLEPRRLPGGTGLLCDIDGGTDLLGGRRRIGLRADIDALPLPDEKAVPYRSTVSGVCHACGHDVHTAAVLGAGLVLQDLARDGALPGSARLVMQPAEEIMLAGATDTVAACAVDGVDRIFALHCDPREVVGRIGLKVGGITASADQLTVRLTGRGGHTARPHLTADVVFALGEVITRLPGALSRRVDPRSGLSLVWGRVSAGTSPNVIPDRGEVSGTVRSLDPVAWDRANELIPVLAREIVAPYGVHCEVDYVRGVPPVMNEPASVGVLAGAVRSVLGEDGVSATEQSLGGEDFAWYLERVPGALMRLGVRGRVDEQVGDLHRGDFDVDERAIGIGVRVLVAATLLALA
jgi:amidohydrolase